MVLLREKEMACLRKGANSQTLHKKVPEEQISATEIFHQQSEVRRLDSAENPVAQEMRQAVSPKVKANLISPQLHPKPS